MLTQSQRNAVFANIETAYTVGGTAYTAIKEYKDRWSGEIDTPVIMLHYVRRTNKIVGAIGRAAEWDSDRLLVAVFTRDDLTNGVHGLDIAEGIAGTLELWFKVSADALLSSNGVKVVDTSPATDLSYLEERVYRLQFEVDLLYKLI